ncbi:polymer-forming cytoskeletal protein [Acidovorax sp. LjRoot118]|uniref:bactofilin family protein n=1 Tax=Acidovorax sp. LjRoot118 TaxID=3342256 RepID=UPI003ECED9E2
MMGLQLMRPLLTWLQGKTEPQSAVILAPVRAAAQWLHPPVQGAVPTVEKHDLWAAGDTLLAKDARFSGTIRQTAGTLTIAGHVEGQVHQPKDNQSLLVVCPGATLKGAAEVDRIHVFGELDAVVDATAVFIARTATTSGAITYSDLHIVKGGHNKVDLVHR